MHFGQILSGLIERRGISQHAVAKIAGIDHTTIGRWRADPTPTPRTNNLEKVLTALARIQPITPDEEAELRQALGRRFDRAIPDPQALESARTPYAEHALAECGRLIRNLGPMRTLTAMRFLNEFYDDAREDERLASLITDPDPPHAAP